MAVCLSDPPLVLKLWQDRPKLFTSSLASSNSVFLGLTATFIVVQIHRTIATASVIETNDKNTGATTKRPNIDATHCTAALSVKQSTRMWANAQRDGRPAEYRWRPLFNAAKFGWPTTRVRCITLPRCETRWNLQRCPKLANRSQPLVGGSSPYYQDMWRRYRCLTSFFQLSMHALVPKI